MPVYRRDFHPGQLQFITTGGSCRRLEGVSSTLRSGNDRSTGVVRLEAAVGVEFGNAGRFQNEDVVIVQSSVIFVADKLDWKARHGQESARPLTPASVVG